jgi:transposase-like protein
MANPIVMAAALSRFVKITCPHCGQHKLVDRKPREYRVCPRCHRQFADPLAKPARR